MVESQREKTETGCLFATEIDWQTVKLFREMYI